MSKNKLNDLNNHLFEQLERLNDDGLLEGDNLKREVDRSKAMTNVAQTIINNAALALGVQKHVDEYGLSKTNLTDILKLESKK